MLQGEPFMPSPHHKCNSLIRPLWQAPDQFIIYGPLHVPQIHNGCTIFLQCSMLSNRVCSAFWDNSAC